MNRAPLSEGLAALLETGAGSGPVTLNRLIGRLDGRGSHLLVIILALPFITPIPLPGVSTVFGAVIVWLACRQFTGRPAPLPEFVGGRPLPGDRWQRVLRGSVRFVRWLEKVVRPRNGAWLRNPVATKGHAILLAWLGFLLVLPFPPFIPFTNSLPAYAVILVAACLMEEDGVLIWPGYGLAALATTYVLLIYGGAMTAWKRYSHEVMEFFRSWL